MRKEIEYRRLLEDAREILADMAAKGWCGCNVQKDETCMCCRSTILAKSIVQVLERAPKPNESISVTVIVNCREHIVNHGQRLSYEDVFRIAFGREPLALGQPLTMTCCWEGSGCNMKPGSHVMAEEGMVFNVVDTGAA